MTHEPRSRTIARHVDAALRATGQPLNALADRAVDLYHQRTALHERTLQFQAFACSADYESASRLNTQQVRRMLEGAVRLAADFEEAIVLALPEPHRDACLRDLAARYGLLAAAVPAAEGGKAQDIAGLMADTGDLLTELAPAYADHVLDAHDLDAARAALPKVLDLQARLASLAQLLNTITRASRAHLRSVAR